MLLDEFCPAQLVRARKELGLSQSQLAAELTMHRSTIVRWEKKQWMPDLAQQLKLAEVLQKPLRFFYEPPDPELVEVGLDEVPWPEVQKLTSGSLRSLKLTSRQIAAVTGFELERVRSVLRGEPPTLEEVQRLLEVFEAAFKPNPQLPRPVPPTTVARKKLKDTEKLDLLLEKFGKLEAELLRIQEFLGIPESSEDQELAF